VKVCLECGARFEARDWLCPQCGRTPARNSYLRFTAGDDAAADAFPEESFAELAEQEDRNFWFRSRNDLIDWALRTYFPHARSFFELGCGTGVVLAALRERRPELDLSGGEPFAAGLDVARARMPDVPLYQIDGRRLPFQEEFDVVGAFDVLEHVDQDKQVLREMYQATRPGGGILVSVPQHLWLWSAVDEFSRHRRRYRAREIVQKIESAGFRVVRKTSFVTTLLPVLALSRWRDRGKKDYDPATEFRLPVAVERLFGGAMWLERKLIARGLSLPVGSSLLLVARRS
jgi:SAM-dependent methyltransferase